jgi:hypothetical protein
MAAKAWGGARRLTEVELTGPTSHHSDAFYPAHTCLTSRPAPEFFRGKFGFGAADPRETLAGWWTVSAQARSVLNPRGLVDDCRVDLHGTFADGQSIDASGFNVCADKTLNLTI